MNLNDIKNEYRDFDYALITDSGKGDHDQYYDVCVSDNIFTVDVCGEKSTDIFDLKIFDGDHSDFDNGELYLDTGDFSYQYRFWRKNRSIKDWINTNSDKILHFNLNVIAAVYTCYHLPIKEVFLNKGIFNDLREGFEKRIIHQFFSVFMKEVDIRISLLGETEISLPSRVNYLESYSDILELIDNKSDIKNPLEYFDMEKNGQEIFDNNNIVYNFSECESCAIVGNGRSILEKEQGPLIDNHDIVVRLNDAPTEGYGENVGSKTDFRVVNSVLAKENNIEDRNNWIDGVRGERLVFNIQRSSDRIDVTKRVVNENLIYFISDSLDQEFESFKRNYGISREKILSTGIQSILLFNLICNSITIFGFDFYEDGNSSHYWEDNNSEFNDTHDWKRERDIIKSFSEKENFIFYD